MPDGFGKVSSTFTSERGHDHESAPPRLFHSRSKCPAADGLQRSRYSVAAVVRAGFLGDRYALFPSSTDTSMGGALLECLVCGDQCLSIGPSFCRASSSQTDT